MTTRENTKLRNAINNNMSTDIKLSKAQIKNIIQSGGFLGSLLGKIAGPLMKVGMSLVKNVLAPLGLTAAMSAIDGSIQKKINGSGATTLVIANEDMNDIMKIIQALENSGIFLKGVTKTIKNETKEQKRGFLSMLLGTLGASSLGNLLSGGKGIVRDKKKSLMPPHRLINFEIREYYENEPRFNGVFSRDNLLKTIRSKELGPAVKNGAYVEYADVGTHWIALYAKNNNEVVYFDSFGVEHIPEEIKKFIGNKKNTLKQIYSDDRHTIQ